MPNARSRRNRRRAQQGRNQQPQFTGQGDYRSTARQLATAATTAIRSANQVVAAARRAQANPGRALRNTAQGAVAGFLGHGDYVSFGSPEALQPIYYNNSLIDPPKGTVTGARVSNVGRRGTRFAQSEFVGIVVAGPMGVGSTLFANKVYTVNPGNPALFPWLSQIAVLFDQWEPDLIHLRYKSTSSEFNGSTQALGMVAAAADYDVADRPYANRQQLEGSDYAGSVKASQNMRYGLECKASERPTKVFYTGAPPSGSSVSANFYNLCTFQLATEGMSAANVVLGELWIDYDITFFKKQLRTTPVIPASAFSQFGSGAEVPSGQVMSLGLTYRDGDLGWQVDAAGAFTNPTASGRYLLTFIYKTTASFDHVCEHVIVAQDMEIDPFDFEEPTRWLGDTTYPWLRTFFTFTVNGPNPKFQLGFAPTDMNDIRSVTIFPIPEGVNMTEIF